MREAADAGEEGRWATLAAGAVLAVVGALAVALMGDLTSIPPRLVALIVLGTCAISLVVGYALGFYGDRGRGPAAP